MLKEDRDSDKKVRLSIITITYNAEAVLERTLKSVSCQTYPEIEYIIIDGQSKDNTVSLIKEYEAYISDWISEPDQGLYDAMNKGLQRATGDYVWFLNAGDTLQGADTVEKVAQIAGKEQFPDILYGETDLVSSDEKFIAQRRLKAPEHLTWKSFRMGMLVCHQSFVMKREMAPLYDLSYRFSADFDWCIRCMRMARNIVNTHLRLTNYLYEGLTTHNRKASLKERYHIMVKNYGKLPVMLLHLWFAVRFYWARIVKGVV